MSKRITGQNTVRQMEYFKSPTRLYSTLKTKLVAALENNYKFVAASVVKGGYVVVTAFHDPTDSIEETLTIERIDQAVEDILDGDWERSEVGIGDHVSIPPRQRFSPRDPDACCPVCTAANKGAFGLGE